MDMSPPKSKKEKKHGQKIAMLGWENSVSVLTRNGTERKNALSLPLLKELLPIKTALHERRDVNDTQSSHYTALAGKIG